MIEPVTHRIRIGCFNIRCKNGRTIKTRRLGGSSYGGGKYLGGFLLLYIGFLTAVLILDVETNKLTRPSTNLKPRIGFNLCQVSV